MNRYFRVKQSEALVSAAKDAVHEMSKPFARHTDDNDLDDLLKQTERSQDPMLAYIKKKQNKKNANIKSMKC